MADTAKQLADAEKNHNRLKKLGTTEATKEFGTYPKYIDALKETRLKLNDAKADHEDSASGETKEPTKEEIQKIREKDIKDIMSTKEKRIKEAEENHEKLEKLGSVEFDTYAEYTKALSNSRLEVNEAKSDHASMAKNVARAERDWKDIPSDWKTEDEDSVPGEAKEPEKKPEPVEEKPKPEPAPKVKKPGKKVSEEFLAAHKRLGVAEKNFRELKILSKKKAYSEHGGYSGYKNKVDKAESELEDARAAHEKSIPIETKRLGIDPWEGVDTSIPAESSHLTDRELDEFTSKYNGMLSHYEEDLSKNTLLSLYPKGSSADIPGLAAYKAEVNRNIEISKRNTSNTRSYFEDGTITEKDGTVRTLKKPLEEHQKLGKRISDLLRVAEKDAENKPASDYAHEMLRKLQIEKTESDEKIAKLSGSYVPNQSAPKAKEPEKEVEEKPKAKEPWEMTSEEASSKIADLLGAPVKETGKPRVVFTTKTEEYAFRSGFQTGSKTPHGPPPPDKPGLSPKDRKYYAAQRHGWSHGAMAGREVEKLRNDIHEGKPVSSAAMEAYGFKLPEGYIKGGGSYVPNQSAPKTKEPEKEVEEKPVTPPTSKIEKKEPWEMTPDTPQSESPVNAPVDTLVQYITGDRLNGPDQFKNLYYKLSDPDRVAVAKELNKRGLLHEIDARKKKPMNATTIINSARGQYRNRYYDSKTEYEDFLSRKAKVTEKKPEVEKEKPKAKEPWEISEREYGEQERQISLTSLREDLRKAKSGEEKPNVFLNGAKSKAALIRTIEKDIEDAKYTKPERYSGKHLGFINKAIREGKDVPQANLDRYDIKTEKPAESAKEPEKVEEKPKPTAATPSKEPVAAETGAKGKQAEAAIHKATGLPLNENGTVTVWHHTSASKAGAIRKTGLLVSDAEPDVYVTTHQKPDTGYGDTAVAIGVNPEKLQLDDEFPNGRRDYSIKTGKPGGSIAVSVDKPATPPKEPVAEVKEMKEKPKQKEFDLTDTPKAKEEKPVEAEVEDAPKGKKRVQLFPKEAKELYALQEELKGLMDKARKGGKLPGDMKAVKDKEDEKSALLVKLGFKKPPKAQERGGEGLLKGRIVPLDDHDVIHEGGRVEPYQTRKQAVIGVNPASRKAEKDAAAAALKAAQTPAPKVKDKEFADTAATNLVTDGKGTPTTNAVTGGKDLPGDQKAGGGVPAQAPAPKPEKPEPVLTENLQHYIYTASASLDNSMQALNNLPNRHPDRKEFFDRAMDHRHILSKLLEKAGYDHLGPIGKTKLFGQDHGLPQELVKGAGEFRKVQEEEKTQTTAREEASKAAQPPVTPDPSPFVIAAGTAPVPPATPTVVPPAPAPAPVAPQRIESTVTPPRIESIVGSTSPLPQTQPAGAAPVAPAPWFPFGQGDGQAPWLPHGGQTASPPVPQTQPAPVAPTPAPVPQPAPTPAPSGRGSQAASQAAAASGAKPIDHGRFAATTQTIQAPPTVVNPSRTTVKPTASADPKKKIVDPYAQNVETTSGPAPGPFASKAQLATPVPQKLKPAVQTSEGKRAPYPQNVETTSSLVPRPFASETELASPAPEKLKPAIDAGLKPDVKQGIPVPPPKKKGLIAKVAGKIGLGGKPPVPPPTAYPVPENKPIIGAQGRGESPLVVPKTGQPKPAQQPGAQPQQQPRPQQPQQAGQKQPVPGKPQQEVPLLPMSRYEKVKRALASTGQGIGRAATSASQSVQRVATHGITKAVLAHLGVAALHGINYPKAIKNLGPKQPRKFNPGWHGFTTPVGKPEDEAKAAEQQKAAPEPKEAAEPKTSGKWERRDR